jgi:hypothetical protein
MVTQVKKSKSVTFEKLPILLQWLHHFAFSSGMKKDFSFSMCSPPLAISHLSYSSCSCRFKAVNCCGLICIALVTNAAQSFHVLITHFYILKKCLFKSCAYFKNWL